MRPPQRVVCAAMLMNDGHIVTGIRHFSPDMRETMRRLYPRFWLLRILGFKSKYHLKVKRQGFVDQYGKFLDREHAWRIADASGQILLLPRCYGEAKCLRPANVGDQEELFSENLY